MLAGDGCCFAGAARGSRGANSWLAVGPAPALGQLPGWCDTYYHTRIIKPRTSLHHRLFILIFLKALARVSASAQHLKSR